MPEYIVQKRAATGRLIPSTRISAISMQIAVEVYAAIQGEGVYLVEERSTRTEQGRRQWYRVHFTDDELVAKKHEGGKI